MKVVLPGCDEGAHRIDHRPEIGGVLAAAGGKGLLPAAAALDDGRHLHFDDLARIELPGNGYRFGYAHGNVRLPADIGAEYGHMIVQFIFQVEAEFF